MMAPFRKIVPAVGMYGFIAFPETMVLEASPYAGRESHLRRNRLFPMWRDWEEGTDVTILAQTGPSDYVVRDRKGQECEVPLFYIDVGWEISLDDGEWHHEFSDRALAFYEEQIPLLQAELDATPPKNQAEFLVLLNKLTEYRSRLEMQRQLSEAPIRVQHESELLYA